MTKQDFIFRLMMGGLAGIFGAFVLAGQADRLAWEMGLIIFILVASVAGESDPKKKKKDNEYI
jgi:hypothetical protein